MYISLRSNAHGCTYRQSRFFKGFNRPFDFFDMFKILRNEEVHFFLNKDVNLLIKFSLYLLLSQST